MIETAYRTFSLILYLKTYKLSLNRANIVLFYKVKSNFVSYVMSIFYLLRPNETNY